jgi:tryptophan-rich sensory protein
MTFWYWFTHQFSGTGSTQSTAEYVTWYASLAKPFFAPPTWLFGVAWGLIYPLIALAMFWALYLYFKKRLQRGFLALFFVNIALNLSFTPILFITRDNTLISLTILLVLGTLALLQVFAWKRSKVIFWLLAPYLLWGAFATVLQLSITAMN